MQDISSIEALQQKLDVMQKELEALKGEGAAPAPEKSEPLNRYKEELFSVQKQVLDIFGKIMSGGVQAVSVINTATAFEGSISWNTMSYSTIDSVQNIPEDGIAAALDVFTNPRRITVLKLLISESLTAGEISQKTGLVGGQLYHHLSLLENAKLIEKNDDKYSTKAEAQALLCGLYTAVGGMDIARR